MLLKIPSLLITSAFVILLVIPVHAVDALTYNKTMARFYTKNGQFSKAQAFVDNGLTLAPDDGELKDLRLQIQASIAKNTADEAAAAKKAAADEKKAEQKAAADDRRANAVLKHDMPCICAFLAKKLQSRINDENRVGENTGIINATKLHQLGSELQVVDKYRLSLPSPDGCRTTYTLNSQTECLSGASNYAIEHQNE